jgi:hypothetical protein
LGERWGRDPDAPLHLADSDEDTEAFKKRWLAKLQGKVGKAQGGGRKQRAKAKTLPKKIRALQQSMKVQDQEKSKV